MESISSFLRENDRHLLLFGGKGGVGKTSLASATALWAADKNINTLLISSDPAHSLSDIFNQDLTGGKIISVKETSNLSVKEIETSQVAKDYQPYLDKYPEYKFILGESLELVPGMIDGFSVIDLNRTFNMHADFDLIIIDTAPTGHTLRFLSFPDFMKGTAMRLIQLRQKVGVFVEKLAGFFRRKKNDKSDSFDDPTEFMEKIKDWAIRTKNLLSNKKITRFNVVSIPESLSINETCRLINQLKQYEIPIGQLLVNKIFPDSDNCEFCRAKKRLQDQELKIIQDKFNEYNPILIPFFKEEICGIDSLRRLYKIFLPEI
ncbi:MAG: ArsA family ATPase [Candidatus Helarchaeota archaeon]